MEIRSVILSEIPQLCDLSRRTFDETFSPTNTAINMRVYMDTYFTQQRLESEINDPKRSIFMAWMENQPVGYLNIYDGPVESCVRAQRPIELARIYVDKAWQGKGIAAELMKKALDVAHKKNKNGMWLGVWENNPRAQAFYVKCGFNKVGSHIFQMGLEPQTDHIFELSLENP